MGSSAAPSGPAASTGFACWDRFLIAECGLSAADATVALGWAAGDAAGLRALVELLTVFGEGLLARIAVMRARSWRRRHGAPALLARLLAALRAVPVRCPFPGPRRAADGRPADAPAWPLLLARAIVPHAPPASRAPARAGAAA
jgi:hypothetical protein